MKWEKWMLNNSNSNDRERAIIAGHYVFSNKEFIELKGDINKKVENLDTILKNEVKNSIYRYMNAFNLT